MTTLLLALLALALLLIAAGWAVSQKQSVTVDCATPGQCNHNWKSDRWNGKE